MTPLAGVRVVELATYVAGPSCGLALARLGADVVRVDPIGGAADRHRWPLAPSGESLYWAGLNQGKRSVSLDLRSAEGRELLLGLVAHRGVLVDNTVGWDWLAHERVRKARPDLVHVRVQGRPDGSPALDYTANAAAGVPTMTGPALYDGPVNHQLPAWDLLTGAQAAAAVMAGVLHRTLTGEGSYAEIALTDVALGAVADLGWVAEAQLVGERPRQGNHVYGSFGTSMRTADGRDVMVVAMTARQWGALLDATGTREVMAALGRNAGLDLDVEENRYRLREAIAAVLAEWFARHDLEAVTKAFDGTRVLWQTYRSLGEAATDPAAPLASVDHPGIGPALTGRGTIRWGGAVPPAPGAAPALGADTRQVLQEELGLAPDDLTRLSDGGTIQ